MSASRNPGRERYQHGRPGPQDGAGVRADEDHRDHDQKRREHEKIPHGLGAPILEPAFNGCGV